MIKSLARHATIYSCMLPLVLASTGAAAAHLFEAEPNNSVAAGQNIDASFTSDFHADITDFAGTNISTTTNHVSIEGTGDGTFDYYRFTVPAAPVTGWFDIDDNNFDTEIAIWDAAGNFLVENDDNTETGHTGGTFPSFITHTFTAPGTYIVGVAEFPDAAGPGGWTGGNPPDAGDSYTLHVSLEQAVPVPVGIPTTPLTALILLSMGIGGLAYAQRRKVKV